MHTVSVSVQPYWTWITLTTLVDSIINFPSHRFQLCQVIACSSLCPITISCAALLPLSAVKFVLLTLRTILNILSNPAKCTSTFLFQVIGMLGIEFEFLKQILDLFPINRHFIRQQNNNLFWHSVNLLTLLFLDFRAHLIPKLLF